MRRYRYRCTVCRTTSPVVHQLDDLAAAGEAHRLAIHGGHIPDDEAARWPRRWCSRATGRGCSATAITSVPWSSPGRVRARSMNGGEVDRLGRWYASLGPLIARHQGPPGRRHDNVVPPWEIYAHRPPVDPSDLDKALANAWDLPAAVGFSEELISALDAYARTLLASGHAFNREDLQRVLARL